MHLALPVTGGRAGRVLIVLVVFLYALFAAVAAPAQTPASGIVSGRVFNPATQGSAERVGQPRGSGFKFFS